MKISERDCCSFHFWYPNFKRQTFRSIIVNVPPKVLSYLDEDGIVLPVEAISSALTTGKQVDINGSDDISNSWNDVDNSEESEDIAEQPSFPEFSDELKSAIDCLGGNVFMKANWSAPIDSSWIIPNKNLKCSSVEELYLLLKSSSRLQDNFKSGKDSCYIVIKKWEDIHPSTEFRCFVTNNSLIGISQRDCSDNHTYIADAKMEIIKDIKKFFINHIKERCSLSNYIFDVVRLSNGRTILVDFGVFDKKYSKSYLFNWDELNAIKMTETVVDEPEFRYIATPTGVQPNFTGFMLPYDLANLSNSKQVIDSIVELIETEMKLQGVDEVEEEE